MTDLLLTHGYFLDDDAKEREVMKPYPPLGLLYVAAYVRRAGMRVEVFDTTFSTRDALVARLSAAPAGVLGIYTNLITRASRAGSSSTIVSSPSPNTTTSAPLARYSAG